MGLENEKIMNEVRKKIQRNRDIGTTGKLNSGREAWRKRRRREEG